MTTVDRFLARLQLRQHRHRRRRRLAQLTALLARQPRHGPGLLPGLRTEPVRPDLPASGRPRPGRRHRRGWSWRSRSATTSASAQAINDAVGAVFEESQIFRIDHYLGKESVQNLLVTRFANTFLEPLWNASWIDHVQITVAESLGVGHPRRLLRQLRRAARHGAEPPAAAAVPGRHGTADLRRPRDRPRREAQGAPGAQADGARRRRPRHRRGSVRTRARRRQWPCAATRTTRRIPAAATETFVAIKAEVQQLALGRRAVLPAHRQADGAARPRRS